MFADADLSPAPIPPGARVAVAMSGGVDSSTVLALLVEQGVEVVGLTMRLWSPPDNARVEGGCCTADDVSDARRVAAALGVPHYVVDYERDFRREVIDPFVASYAAGETPNPCVLCNNHLKFDLLLERALSLGCSLLATGHYARVAQDGAGSFRLLRAADPAKDQSYFLFGAAGRILNHLRFPLGHLSKDEVRTEAARLGVRTANKPDSQDVCFIPDGKTARFVERALGAPRPGPVVDADGAVVGQHDGVHRFTVGQRRGLGIASRSPLYVLSLDASRDQVTVGSKDALLSDVVAARDVRWIREPLPGEPVWVRLRSRSTSAEVASMSEEADLLRLQLTKAHPRGAPGQALVLYGGVDAAEVLGGGWIDSGGNPPLRGGGSLGACS